MEAYMSAGASLMPSKLKDLMLKPLLFILSAGLIPNHMAFIMDGNRRFAKKHNLPSRMGHMFGFISLINILKFCYELGVKHITIYAFSIDNFKRSPEEVKSLMDLLQESLDILLKEDSIVNHYGVRVNFAGDLKLLDEPTRVLIQKLVGATSEKSDAGLTVCVAYTSTDEITRAVEKAFEENRVIGLEDVERSLDLSIAGLDPDIIIRTSGETRLSNFMTWQSAWSLLCSPSAEWPVISIWHLVWAVLNFQRMRFYFEKKKKIL